MGVLTGLEPEKVFYYFEEITKIPHGSGNVEAISDYLVDFAKSRGLFWVRDKWMNVIIVKEATYGYENEPAVMLQGHMDMVAVSQPGYHIDMTKEGLKIAVDGDNIYACGTSLGGDDGIAVAYMLALLDSDSLQHPRLEVVITVDEEVGMDGAKNINLSMLQAKRLINLDSEDEGIFLTSCAGGARVNCSLKARMEERKGVFCGITIGGLLGGHSGTEIHRGRGNSNCIFARVLRRLTEEFPVQLVELKGGRADNAIPRDTRAILLLPLQEDTEKGRQRLILDARKVDRALAEVRDEITQELEHRDPNFLLKWSMNSNSVMKAKAVLAEDTRKIAQILLALPNGVQSMSTEIPDLVETSLNFGILNFKEERIHAAFSIRSSLDVAKYALIDRLKAIMELAGGDCTVAGDYPGWKYRANSPLRDKMIAVYEDMYGERPEVEGIHAGLECGLLAGKIPDLDCVSMGPQMYDVHTTEETLSISSTARVWEYLVKLLATKEIYS